MKTLEMELSDEDITILKELISKSGNSTIKAALNKALAEVDNEIIVHDKVCVAIDKLSILKLNDIVKRSNDPKTQNLLEHFYLSSEDKKSLSSYFTQILQLLGSTEQILPSECEELETFSDCTKLILEKI